MFNSLPGIKSEYPARAILEPFQGWFKYIAQSLLDSGITSVRKLSPLASHAINTDAQAQKSGRKNADYVISRFSGASVFAYFSWNRSDLEEAYDLAMRNDK